MNPNKSKYFILSFAVLLIIVSVAAILVFNTGKKNSPPKETPAAPSFPNTGPSNVNVNTSQLISKYAAIAQKYFQPKSYDSTAKDWITYGLYLSYDKNTNTMKYVTPDGTIPVLLTSSTSFSRQTLIQNPNGSGSLRTAQIYTLNEFINSMTPGRYLQVIFAGEEPNATASSVIYYSDSPFNQK